MSGHELAMAEKFNGSLVATFTLVITKERMYYTANHTSIHAVTDMYVGFKLLPSVLCLGVIIIIGSLS